MECEHVYGPTSTTPPVGVGSAVVLSVEVEVEPGKVREDPVRLVEVTSDCEVVVESVDVASCRIPS